ncbi:MAG: Re/Si-specific NAD(P)(+) transhydrogenase subunit alpha [Phycisphaerales bacterium]|nr:Re/Si-specific NAD(P)(+) transhydrogenase subunit alpha [Phycisphaerales bacterium]
MRIGIPKEIHPGERRVASTPKTVSKLIDMGFEVVVEEGAGIAAEHYDEMYAQAGATLTSDVKALWGESDIVLKVHSPQVHPSVGIHEADMIKEGGCLIGFIWPAQNQEILDKLNARNASALAMDCVPRITRAQKVDALSAMANAAGYRAVIEAVNVYPRFLTGQSTAAGAIKPAKVLVIGAGVAGLAAIGAANALGAIVRAFDTRLEVGEQVRSMGAEFLELDFKEEGSGSGGYAKVMSDEFIEAEMKLFAQQAMEVDIIITTALIPGKPAPRLISAGMVESMREGSVIVDMAAQQGGNCALTQADKMIVHKGVRIVGYTDLASRMAIQTSWLYASTLVSMLDEMGGDENFTIDLENDIVRGALVCHEGSTTWPPPQAQPVVIATSQDEPSPEATPATGPAEPKKKSNLGSVVVMIITAVALLALGRVAPSEFLSHFTVFVLACFVGWQVVWNVTPALHTPLMSVTNAISGIILIGGMLHLSGLEGQTDTLAVILGAAAVFLAAINISGGFLVTRRMLQMFQK